MPKLRWILPALSMSLWLPGANLPAAPGASQRAGGPFTIDVWEPEDHLPGSSVIAVTQSRVGYLWLGTLYGLARFDGLHFTVFDENNTPALGTSRIVFLFEDSQTNLWIGTDNAGIALVKEGEVTRPLELALGGPERRLVAACEDAAGAVWLCRANGELLRYWQGRFTPLVLTPDGMNETRSVIDVPRTVIHEPGGFVWVGTPSRQCAVGPVATDVSLQLPVAEDLSVSNLDFLLASPGGGYWRLAGGRVQKWTTNRLDRDLGPYPWGGTRITAACEDRQGNLIVGTWGNGLYWFNEKGEAIGVSTNDGLSYNIILSLHMDREGDLWVGTDGGGLNRVKRQVFEVLEESRGMVIQSTSEDDEDGLWFGSNGHGVGHWNKGVLQPYGPERGLLSRTVRTVFADRSQRTWAGTWDLGLFRFQSGRFQLAVGVGVIPTTVRAIHQDRTEQLWLGTSGGLIRWSDADWHIFTTADGLSSDLVTAMADDAEGNLWVGTERGGLNRFRDGRFTSLRKEDSGLPSDNVSFLLVDADGVLWISTSSGLARLVSGQWTQYSTRDGLISNSLGYLIEDGHGHLWIGSNAGLLRVPKKALNDFAHGLTNSVPCRAYGRSDGLPTGECTFGSQPGPCRTRDGRLWFPTIKGLASVDPGRLKSNPYPPPVVIESVLIEGQEKSSGRLGSKPPQAVTIPAGRERLEIRYTSLNLAAPDRAHFRYRLEGHETAWIEAGNSRVARYSKLAPGEYRFLVTAANEDGVWNDQGSALAVTVEPPFWRTWWFLTLLAGCLLATIVAVVHYFSTQKLQRQLAKLRQEEALERERARIARDLHDQLGASLTQVALLGEMAESDKDSPDEVETHARQISQTARETTGVLDEIVWAVNPSNDTLEGLINYACKYAQEYLAVAGLRYRLEVPPQLPDTKLPPDLRHNVFLAFKEAVTNVVRHARASSAWVRLRLDSEQFSLEVEDNGRGPAEMKDPAKQARSGLRNMRKRMEDVGGSFFIGPGAEGGTTVRLTAPLDRC